MPKEPIRIAHVHLMRTAGTFVSAYLCGELGHQMVTKNSWFEGLHRDWSKEEMREFAIMPGSVYVHNHVESWDADLIAMYKRNGFFVFTFVRDIGDQLCSLYHWARERNPKMRSLSVDEFIIRQLNFETTYGLSYRHWAIPEYWLAFDFTARFSIGAFELLLKHTLGLQWNSSSKWASRQNKSSNPGYQNLCDIGDVSASTQYLVEQSELQQRFRATNR